MTTALIDGDICVYRCACSAEKDETSIALMRTDLLMQEIMSATGADSYKLFLSAPTGANNFRTKLDPNYKLNRAKTPRPTHFDAVRTFLVTHWKAEMVEGYEADDAMGMAQTEGQTIICSIDKDMLQVPGNHWNFVKKEARYVTEDEGLKAFFTQTLVGDRSDNITGVPGIGPVKAAKILDPLTTSQYYKTCLDLYCGDIERFHMNCKLLWIWRTMNDVWQPPEDPLREIMA